MRTDGVRCVRGVRNDQAVSAGRRLGTWAALLLLFSMLWALLLTPGAAASTHERFDDCEVVGPPVDGDTVDVNCGETDEKERVRLHRINTVEKGEPGYAEAGAELEEMIGGRPVRLEFETPGRAERDKSNRPRLLAYLFVDGRNLNVEMVRECWSYFYTEHGEGRFADDFREAEKQADCSGESKLLALHASGFIGPCDALVRVVDGDTVYLKCRAEEFYRMQLSCIDAPDKGEPSVKSSRLVLRQWLDDRDIRFLDKKEGRKEYSFRRRLSYLQDIESGKIINVEMVREGHACYKYEWCDDESRFHREFSTAQAECNENKRCRARIRCEQGESDR